MMIESLLVIITVASVITMILVIILLVLFIDYVKEQMIVLRQIRNFVKNPLIPVNTGLSDPYDNPVSKIANEMPMLPTHLEK